MNAGAPDLVSEGQGVVVKQQAVHGNRKKPQESIRVNPRFVPPGHKSEIWKSTLLKNLERSMKPMTLQCKKEDAQSMSNPDHLRASNDGWYQSGKDGQQATDGHRSFDTRGGPRP